MLGLAGDEMFPFLGIEMCNTLDCQVVGLGGARGENQPVGIRVEQVGELQDVVAVDCLVDASGRNAVAGCRMAPAVRFGRPLLTFGVVMQAQRPIWSKSCPIATTMRTPMRPLCTSSFRAAGVSNRARSMSRRRRGIACGRKPRMPPTATLTPPGRA